MILTKYDEWLNLAGPVAVTIRTPLEPVMGADAVLFPPTFAAPAAKTSRPIT